MWKVECVNVRKWKEECTNVENTNVECTNVRMYESTNVDNDEESRVEKPYTVDSLRDENTLFPSTAA